MHVWIIFRLLPMKAGWWDAPLALWNLAETICMILTMGGSPFWSHGGSLAVKFLPQLSTHPTPIPSEPSPKRFPHRHYQELQSSHNSPTRRTHSTVYTLSPCCFCWADTQHLLHPRISPSFFLGIHQHNP